jgi:hypothetical protein
MPTARITSATGPIELYSGLASALITRGVMMKRKTIFELEPSSPRSRCRRCQVSRAGRRAEPFNDRT